MRICRAITRVFYSSYGEGSLVQRCLALGLSMFYVGDHMHGNLTLMQASTCTGGSAPLTAFLVAWEEYEVSVGLNAQIVSYTSACRHCAQLFASSSAQWLCITTSICHTAARRQAGRMRKAYDSFRCEGGALPAPLCKSFSTYLARSASPSALPGRKPGPGPSLHNMILFGECLLRSELQGGASCLEGLRRLILHSGSVATFCSRTADVRCVSQAGALLASGHAAGSRVEVRTAIKLGKTARESDGDGGAWVDAAELPPWQRRRWSLPSSFDAASDDAASAGDRGSPSPTASLGASSGSGTGSCSTSGDVESTWSDDSSHTSSNCSGGCTGSAGTPSRAASISSDEEVQPHLHLHPSLGLQQALTGDMLCLVVAASWRGLPRVAPKPAPAPPRPPPPPRRHPELVPSRHLVPYAFNWVPPPTPPPAAPPAPGSVESWTARWALQRAHQLASQFRTLCSHDHFLRCLGTTSFDGNPSVVFEHPHGR